MKTSSQSSLKIEVDGYPQAEGTRCSIGHQRDHVNPRSLLVHGSGQTPRCLNHASFVKESSLATAVGETPSDHGWSMYTRREPRTLGDEIITRPQTATIKVIERLGAGPKRKRGEW